MKTGAFNSSVYGNNIVVNSFIRNNDLTPYSANDVVSNNQTTSFNYNLLGSVFNNNFNYGYVTGAQIITTEKTCTARMRLHLFNVSGGAINNTDNVAFSTLLNAMADPSYLGYIDFPALATYGGAADAASAQVTDLRHFIFSPNQTIYWVLQTLDAFTPTAFTEFDVKLLCDLTA